MVDKIKGMTTMAQKDLQKLKEEEYEYLYNLRDLTVLYLRMSQSNLGYVEELYSMVDEMVKNLAGQITSED